MSKLNELLSIIIPKLNASVKTEAQTLTKEQKAQARENIGAVPTPNHAETGQALVVKTVDENGVPTEWEAADVKLPEITLSQHLVANTAIALSADEAAQLDTLMADGSPFICNAFDETNVAGLSVFMSALIADGVVFYTGSAIGEKQVYVAIYKMGDTWTASMMHTDLYTPDGAADYMISRLPSSIPNIQSAKKGQIIRVKSVNQVGFPTEWEVVDNELPVATELTLGAVKAVAATEEMTEEVGVNPEGQLVTKSLNATVLDGLLLKDAENGFTYVVEMRNGSLVSSMRCVGVKITTPPDKTKYVEGESSVDITGMVVSAVYEDGSLSAIENYTYSETISEDGIFTISWLYRGSTFTDSITFEIVPLSEALVDFEYIDNGDGTYTLTDWKGTLNGEESTEIVIPNSSKIVI